MKQFFLILLLAPAFSIAGESRTLHTILICDTQAENIEQSVKIDLRNMQQLAKKVAKVAHMNNQCQAFRGAHVKTALLERLKKLRVGRHDTIILYFSGHGYNTRPTKQRWPLIYLTPCNASFDFYTLFTLLKEKEPQLLIAIADCCNNVIDWWATPEPRRALPSSHKLWEKEGYRILFTEQHGTIIASGCGYDEYTWGTGKGGFFTNAWIAAIQEQARSVTPSWEAIFSATKSHVVAYALNQNPQYEIDLQKQ